VGARGRLAGRLGSPATVLRIGALSLALVMASLGALRAGALGEPCLPGELAGVGEVERAVAVGEPPSSSLTLRGAPTEYLFGTDVAAAYARGDFVVVCGSPEGAAVRGHSIRGTADPAAAAFPYFAGALGLAAGLLLDFALPRLLRSKGEGEGQGRAFQKPWPGMRREGAGERESADNHSGAPAGKD